MKNSRSLVWYIKCLAVTLSLVLGFSVNNLYADGYQFKSQWGGSGTGSGTFGSPYGVAVDSSGNVYVADSGNYLIQKFDSSGTFLKQWGGIGTGSGKFGSPYGVAVDSSGNVYVADSGNYLIQKFDSNGVFKSQWGGSGTGNGKFGVALFGIAVDSGGYVYVADTANNLIQKFDSNGTFLRQWGGSGTGNGTFKSPFGVAADSSGNVYVADTVNGLIQKFASNGTFKSQWHGDGDNSSFSEPSGIAVDSAGYVYAVDPINNLIHKFDSNGVFQVKWGGSGTGNGQFAMAYGVAVDSVGNVYVSDKFNYLIQKFAPSSSSGYALSVSKVGAGTGTVTSDPSGISCGATCSSSYAVGTSVTLNAVADTGSSVASWTGCDSSSGPFCTVSMSAAKAVTVTFTALYSTSNTLTVTKSGTGTGTVTASSGTLSWSGSTGTASYTSSTSVTLTAAAASGSTFSAWTGCDSTSGATCTVAMSANKSVTATFTSSASSKTYGTTNVALGLSVTASSNTVRGSTSNVTDADHWSTWWSYQGVNPCTFGGTHENQDFVLDLGSVHTLGKIQLLAQQVFGITVSTSTDNANWSTVFTHDWPASSQVPLTIALDGTVSARYIKYHAYASWCQYVGITDFEVYDWVTTTSSNSIGTTNVALNKHVDAFKNDYQTVAAAGTYSEQNADDGNTATSTIPSSSSKDGNESSVGGYIRIDLGQVYNLGQLVVTPKNTQILMVEMSQSSTCLICGGVNNVPWVAQSYPALIGTNTGSSDAVTFTLSASVPARYIWLLTGAYGGPTNTIQPGISEVAAYEWVNSSSTYTLSVTESGTGTVTSSPSGINCGSTCSASYASGTSVTLTAAAGSGSTFSSWSGCDSTNAQYCAVTMSANKSVTATFTSSGTSDYNAASAEINAIYGQYASFFGTTSGGVLTGTSGSASYYVQWFTNGSALVAWTDGLMYTYYNGTWYALGISWQTSSDLTKATTKINAIYNQYASTFGSETGTIQTGTYGSSTYYVQWCTNGAAIVAWTDGTMFVYYNGQWYALGVNWK